MSQDAPHTLTTNTELLLGLRDAGNDAVWDRFSARYRPMLVAFARRLGLGNEEADDAAQETLINFLRAFREQKYDRDKGRLRSWLFGIATNAVRRQRRGRGREQLIDDRDRTTAFADRIPDEDGWDAVWDAEWRESILQASLSELRSTTEPHTMRAFELYVLEERPAAEVADEVGISRDAVFQLKRRLLDKLRTIMAALETEW